MTIDNSSKDILSSSDFTLEEVLAIAIKAALAAGEKIVEMLYSAEVHEKSPRDLVTDADVAAQAIIYEILLGRYPDHQFVGEEGAPSRNASSVDVVSSIVPQDCWCWVVDPIDGTTNYVHRFPNFAVSIALVRSGISYLGVIYDPMAKDLFTATLGLGATLNGEAIQASGCSEMEQALIAASFPPNVQRGSIEVEQFLEVLVEAQSLRRLGSAALNLCYVACGRLDGYWAGKVRSWDVAAGVLIAQEAGCTLTAMNGGPFVLDRGDLVVAASPELHSKLVDCLNRVRSGIKR